MPRKTTSLQTESSGTHRPHALFPFKTAISLRHYNSFIPKDLAEWITTFTRSTDDLCPVTITNVTAIASYSWIEASSRTIAVPGSPKVWYTDPNRVPADSGRIFVDQNAFCMYPMSPLVPLFAAIDDMHPSFDYKQFDFITDSNNFCKLLRWAMSSSDQKDFRIDVDVQGPTCLFTRCEGRNSINLPHFVGHGLEYKKAATRTTRGCEKATGHHRMISIDIGGLRVLLRFAVEACTSSAKDVDDNDDVIQGDGALSGDLRPKNSKASAPIRPPRKKKIQVFPVRGVSTVHTTPRKLVPQSSLINITTCTDQDQPKWAELYLQLYLSQTKLLYVAKHYRGNFSPPEKLELSAESMEPHACRTEQGIAKMKVLLESILDAVKKEDFGVGMSLVGKDGQLALYKRQEGTGKVLGNDIKSKFK